MVFFGQIHPETVQSKTCKGLFLANFARPPRQTFLSKELVKKKHARAHFWPILLASWGILFVKGVFTFFLSEYFFTTFLSKAATFLSKVAWKFFFQKLHCQYLCGSWSSRNFSTAAARSGYESYSAFLPCGGAI